ncbi:MAG: FAD-dependent oxidoreductase [Myxococcota bacterium]
MSDKMVPLPIDRLFTLTFAGLARHGSIFGLPREQFFDPRKYPQLACQRYGQLLETPWGVAAGPQTQLSQNLLVAWLVGARYLELKTVQTLDEIAVSKPCIDMEDVGYNCEWSQELKLDEAYREYLNAWILIHIVQQELGLTRNDGELGCIFNMSAGYNMEGLLASNTQRFLHAMMGSPEGQAEYERAMQILEPLYPRVRALRIPVALTNNITLSTMHGCPPAEIERIGAYLIGSLKLHTTVKLNPTLNGPEVLRDILNRKLGYTRIDVPDTAFAHDLKWPDAVRLVRTLREQARSVGVEFNLKLTNTLETTNHRGVFAKSNEMMYMSGRPLHALAINVAKMLQEEFWGELDLSLSGGADAFNAADLLACGIKPVTVCTDLLKPGGYARLLQYSENAAAYMAAADVTSLAELPGRVAQESDGRVAVQKNIAAHLSRVLSDPAYHQDAFPWTSIKGKRQLGLFDCIAAPCTETCPAGQDVPSYIWLASQGRFPDALGVIRDSNPFPNTTGMACDHVCEDRCTRMSYDATVRIRDLKRYIAMKEEPLVALRGTPGDGYLKPRRKVMPDGSPMKSIAIIGGGPAGLSAAWFLSREGLAVEIFEAKTVPGGMVSHALPDFRTAHERVTLDIERIKAMGVRLHENTPITTRAQFAALLNEHDYVFVAVGAKRSKVLGIPGETCAGVVGFLEFLERTKHGELGLLPKRVAVVGGGNSAIDAVRSAKRRMPEGGELMLLYRRTVKEMPASREELLELRAEKIRIVELTAPVRVISEGGQLRALECQQMQLVAAPTGGRPRPQAIPGSEHQIPLDLLIPAIGQDTELDFLAGLVPIGPGGLVSTQAGMATTHAKVFAGGDVVRGPSSIIQGIADGRAFASHVLTACALPPPPVVNPVAASSREGHKVKDDEALALLRRKRARRVWGTALPRLSEHQRDGFEVVVQTMSDAEARAEADRCLLCDELCDVCVTVCPNRANVSYRVPRREHTLQDWLVEDGTVRATGAPYTVAITQEHQTLNVGDLCNECGNCQTFCPTAGAPYRDKPKVYLSRATFDAETHDSWYLDAKTATLWSRIEGATWSLRRDGERFHLVSPIAAAELDAKSLTVVGAVAATDAGKVSMRHVLAMAVLLVALSAAALFVS